MAAVLCRALCKPFELCCKGCSNLCDNCSDCCGQMFECIQETFKRPFSCCLFLVTLANIGPAGYALVSAFTNLDNDCEKPLHVWLLLTAVNLFGNIAMGLYMFMRFKKPYDQTNPKDHDFVARMYHMACEDIGVAFYIIFFIWTIVWQIIGGIWRSDSDKEEPGYDCPDSLLTAVQVVNILFWVFIIIGVVYFFCDWMAKILSHRVCPACAEGDCGCCFKLCCPCCFTVEKRHTSRRRQHRQPVGAPAQHHISQPPPHPYNPPPPQSTYAQQQYYGQTATAVPTAPPATAPAPTPPTRQYNNYPHNPPGAAAHQAPPPQQQQQQQQQQTGDPDESLASQVGGAVASGFRNIGKLFGGKKN